MIYYYQEQLYIITHTWYTIAKQWYYSKLYTWYIITKNNDTVIKYTQTLYFITKDNDIIICEFNPDLKTIIFSKNKG